MRRECQNGVELGLQVRGPETRVRGEEVPELGLELRGGNLFPHELEKELVEALGGFCAAVLGEEGLRMEGG